MSRGETFQWLMWLACALFLHGPTRVAADVTDTWRVDRIEIRGNLRTHDDIVRRELLFSVGDTVDAHRLAETERNLRRLLFLGDVILRFEAISSEATQPRPGRAIVDVSERHSRALSPLLDGEAQELSYGLVALDYNFLGRGQVAQVTFFHDAVTGNEIRGTYREPRLAGSRHALRLSAGYAGDEGKDLSVLLSKPFYALNSRWAYGLALAHDRERVRLYSGGVLAARYHDELASSSLWLSHSIDHGGWKIRPGLRLGISDREFAPDSSYTYRPNPRRRVLPSLSLTLWRPAYARERFVRGLGQIEDLQTGGWMTLQAGYSAETLGSDRSYPVAAIALAPRGQPTPNSFLFGLISVSSRWREGKPWHMVTSVSGSSYLRYRQSHVWAMRIAYHALHRIEDRGAQLLLGVDTGLRGYDPRRFDGTRRILAGVEARPILWRHEMAVVGAALFADAGKAWTSGSVSQPWVESIGAGFRIGLPTVYDTPILRVDLAHGLQARQAWQVAFGLGHPF